jgi:hypothetical protein
MNVADHEGNPFSTRYVRPGALPYEFPAGHSAQALVDRLANAGWWGEIVGPHGSGKSSLLAALCPALTAAGRRVVQFVLRDGQRRLPPEAAALAAAGPETLVVVDGYEQLSRLARWRLVRLCRRRRLGLLVTAHAPAGLPPLAQTEVTLATAQCVVARLVEGWPRGATEEEVERAWRACGGNLREALFDLYHRYEHGRGRPSGFVSERKE